LCGTYGSGKFYVLTIPDAMADIYKLPSQTLTILRKELNLPVTLECTARVGLFLYGNNTFVLQSFLERPERVRVKINKGGASIIPLGKMFRFPPRKSHGGDDESVFDVHLMPGRYMAFKIEG
jgi:hypothetical protein